MPACKTCRQALVRLSNTRWFCPRCRALLARFELPEHIKPGDGIVV